MSNLEGTAACTFTVTDNAYDVAQAQYTVPAGQSLSFDCPLGASYGWYDVSITSNTEALWLRRLAGHVETGRASRTDPLIGTNRVKVALDCASLYVMRGAAVAFSYAAPAGKLDAQNWVGVYAQGSSPGAGNSLL